MGESAFLTRSIRQYKQHAPSYGDHTPPHRPTDGEFPPRLEHTPERRNADEVNSRGRSTPPTTAFGIPFPNTNVNFPLFAVQIFPIRSYRRMQERPLPRKRRVEMYPENAPYNSSITIALLFFLGNTYNAPNNIATGQPRLKRTPRTFCQKKTSNDQPIFAGQ